ncbi:MAG: hypothetical protein AAGA67_02570 [Cyanobacteria bacterium P01_F01_bin.153]
MENLLPSNATPSKGTLWTNVIALAILQGAIAFAWVAYRAYLPVLFEQVGLPGTEVPVSRGEDFLAIALEPMMGFWSDRYRATLGKRFSFVAVGVGIAALILLVVPAIAAGRSPVMGIVLTILLISWAIAMAAFRSPAIALLRQYALETRLAQSMGLLLFAMAMVGAFAKPLQTFLLDLGAPTALGGSSLVLVASAGILQLVKPDRKLTTVEIHEAPPSLKASVQTTPWTTVSQVLLLGGAIAWGLRLIVGSLGPVLVDTFPTITPGPAVFAFLFTAACLAVPAGTLNSLWGLRKMVSGAALMLMLTVTGLQTPLPVNAVIIFIVISMLAWTVVFNGVIPLGFLALTGDRGGLAVGAYFGGFAAGMALLNWTPFSDILETTSSRAGASGIVFAVIAFLTFQLGRSRRVKTSQLSQAESQSAT